MSQRLIAACVAVPAVLALLVFATVAKLPYATYVPGGTIDVLGEDGNGDNAAEIIQVDGHEVFRDDGQLRLTTVRVSQPAVKKEDRGLPLNTLLTRWFDGDDAVYPYAAVHPEDETPESSQEEGALQMATSQESAVEVALRELDIDVPQILQVGIVFEDGASVGTLEVGDTLLSINGTRVRTEEQLQDRIQDNEAGTPVTIGLERGGTRKTVKVTPQEEDGRQLIGIRPGYDYDFPFDVKINISPNIGGPSAGLVFSLAVYDTLSPGSLTGGHAVAGTGEIAPDGKVGPIGGIQQKIAGARDDGAELFLVPEANCVDALGADPGDMRLMMARTMHQARLALEQYAADPDVTLPACEDARDAA